MFEDIVSEIPADILSEDSVESERRRERIKRDRRESQNEGVEAGDSIARISNLIQTSRPSGGLQRLYS